MFQKLRSIFPALFFVCCLCAVHAADVCRLTSFAGMDAITRQIHQVLGEDTTDLRKIRVYVTDYQGTTYIQSNYRSIEPDTGGRSSNPTKIRSNDIKDLPTALTNIVFWGEEGTRVADAREQLATALANVEILVDSSLIDPHGRTAFDLSGADKIRLATTRDIIPTGKIELLDLGNPPPAMAELIDGCCFYGRPPGQARAIVAKFSQRPVDRNSFTLLSLVTDRATQSVISASAKLRPGQARALYSNNDAWPTRIDKAIRASRGQALVVLSHIEGTEVVVQDAQGNALYRTQLSALRDLATSNQVELSSWAATPLRLSTKILHL
jgi:hypothetical protein